MIEMPGLPGLRPAVDPMESRRRLLARAGPTLRGVLGVDLAGVLGEPQTRELNRARHALTLALARARPGWGSPRLGRALARDHSSILHRLACARALEKADLDFAGAVAALQTALARGGDPGDGGGTGP